MEKHIKIIGILNLVFGFMGLVAGAICLAARHGAFHAGQIATLRRLLGEPFLR